MKRIVIIPLALCLFATTASAFPADSAYVPFTCDRTPMGDRPQDTAGADGPDDVVGDSGNPAGLRAADDQNLYLRLRVEGDPAPGGALVATAWGFAFDLDGDLSNYEVLVMVDGTAGGGGTVLVYRNSTITVANSPADPADSPAAASFTFAANARKVVAGGSQFLGSDDFFIDFQVPWSALQPLGLDKPTPVSVWAGSSTVPDALDLDLACHDGATGTATLDGTSSDGTTGDPAQDPDPPPPTGDIELEGGGGCSAGHGACPLLVLAALAAACRRRRDTRSRARSEDRAKRFLYHRA
jgi:hypothetical protein